MGNHHPAGTSTRAIERVLSGLGLAICLIQCAWIAQQLSQQRPIAPLTASYLVEVGLVSGLFWAAVERSGSPSSTYSSLVAWAAVGVLTGFIVMGLWSIGSLFIPVDLIFIVTAILANRRRNESIRLHVGVGVLAAIAQASVMLFIVRSI
jgi:hypothetical protein